MSKQILILLIILIFPYYSSGVVLEPIVQTVEEDSKRRMIFTVRNATQEPIPAELRVLEVIGVKDHREIRVETEDIVLSHEQLILGAAPLREELLSLDATIKAKAKRALQRSRKTIRVEFVGDEIPKQQKLYRILAYEPDIPGLLKDEGDAKSAGAKIKIKFQSEGFIFVQQPNVKPELYIDDVELKDGIGAFTLKNRGTASMYLNILEHKDKKEILAGIKVHLKSGKSYMLDRKAFADFNVFAFKRVLPNQQIRYQFSYNKAHHIDRLELILPE